MTETTAKAKAVVNSFVNRRQFTLAALGAVVGLGVGLAIATSFSNPRSLVTSWENSTIDIRLRKYAEPEKVSPDLTVLLIDDATEREFRVRDLALPPDRAQFAKLLEALRLYKPRAVIFDYLFDNSPTRTKAGHEYFDPFLNEYGSRDESTRSLLFGQASALLGRVVVGTRVVSFAQGATPDSVIDGTGYSPFVLPYFEKRLVRVTARGTPPPFRADPGAKVFFNYPQAHIVVGARGFGLTNIIDDDADDIIRRVYPVLRLDGRDYVQLSIAGMAVATMPTSGSVAWANDAPPAVDALGAPASVRWDAGSVSIGDRYRLPLRDDGSAWIRWRGNWEGNPALALHAHTIAPWLDEDNQNAIVLGDGNDPAPAGIDRAEIENKVVLIGFSAHGEFTDKVSTPFGFQPGVFLHAAVLDTILTGDSLRSLPWRFDAGLVVVMAMLVGALVVGLPKFDWLVARGIYAIGTYQALLVILPLTLWALLAFLAFPRGWVINVVPAELAMGGTGLITFFASIALERAGLESQRVQKEQALSLAKKALSPELVERYQAEYAGGSPPLGGERVNLTVYFSDIQGFTTISEQLAPEELIGILNEYLSRVTELMVDKHRAYLDKYIGDAVMAFWGAPIPAPDGPLRACLAAIDIMAVMDAYSAELVTAGLSPLKTRIGINTGPAIAGVVGHAKSKINYTALGDTVNLASRLEGANKAYGTTCMLGPATMEAVKDVILGRELDLVKVKGKHQAVRVFELLGRVDGAPPEKREIKRRYESALALFRARKFEEARTGFAALIAEFGDTPSRTLLRCCDERMATPPPPDWDGSNELHEK